ncbi:uncharacterized protein BDW43DRAFT_271516 [Aspergillus alliaceus]|uniref:uncharacterized protein n=1 Tax=Petromyces alliaceus TaxID=209559 RepID=UPI0012A3D0E6|nr:uncharacterized protein BDW43DRAFT_271516 [Aspergillus alliaceus]KAB8235299.1 hypothetical protein BDW43DRAFT_271516 [Aspergillus alliaceus]
MRVHRRLSMIIAGWFVGLPLSFSSTAYLHFSPSILSLHVICIMNALTFVVTSASWKFKKYKYKIQMKPRKHRDYFPHVVICCSPPDSCG